MPFILLADASDFSSWFPDFATKVHTLSAAVVPVAAVLCFAGLVRASIAAMHGNYTQLFGKLVTVAAIAVAIGQIGSWTQQLAGGVNDLVVNQLNVNPANVSQEFQQILTSPSSQDSRGWWDKIMSPNATFAQAIAAVVVWLIGKIAWLIMWWSGIAQTSLLYFAISLAPIFLGMFAVDSMKQVGFRWALGVVSICIWPLGWAVADILTDGLLKNAANLDLVNATGGTAAAGAGATANALQIYIVVLAASVWIIVSTIAAPVIISTAIISGGAMIGGQLFGAGVKGVNQGAAFAANTSMATSGGLAGAAAIAGGGGGATASGGGGGTAGGTTGGGSAGTNRPASAGSAGVNASAPPTPIDVVAQAEAMAATL